MLYCKLHISNIYYNNILKNTAIKVSIKLLNTSRKLVDINTGTWHPRPTKGNNIPKSMYIKALFVSQQTWVITCTMDILTFQCQYLKYKIHFQYMVNNLTIFTAFIIIINKHIGIFNTVGLGCHICYKYVKTTITFNSYIKSIIIYCLTPFYSRHGDRTG